ncbi:MAG TPA: membrane protein insertase YidC [Bryobacteraceae bacterium]|jgi:YidC/Oxa1 family membrane protein insertase
MPNSPGGASPKPPSLEKRLPIALALMMLVLLASQYFFKPAPGPKPVKPEAENHPAQVTQKPAAAKTGPIAASEESTSPPNRTQAAAEAATEIDTALYHIVFSNRGAVAKSWVLKKYRDDAGKPLELISHASDVPLPFALDFTGQKPSFDANAVLYQPKLSADGLTLTYTYSDGNNSVQKSFSFKQDSYLSQVKSSVLVNGTPVPALLMWRGGFGDAKVHNAAATQHTVRFDASASKLVTKTAKDAKNGPVTDSGNYTFAGLEDSFFAAVALPAGASTLEVRTYSDSVKPPGEDKPQPYVGAGLSTGPQDDLSFFVGPKDVDILKAVNPKLSQLIDWGFFGVIAKPLFIWLKYVNDHWTFHNYGWAIILVTLIINLALFPFRLQSLKSARKMQKLQPQIQAINAKYKGLSMRDPKKAEQNQEVMALYKKEGVNPVGGCLPLLVQLPFFYAFYRVLAIAIDLRHASWLWVPDLSSPESLPIHLLPIILIATQFFSQKLTPAAGVDPNQQKMMMFMPLLFGFMFYYASAGLVLYWLTGNIVGIVQQLIINRFMPTPVPPPPPPGKAPVKRTVKK